MEKKTMTTNIIKFNLCFSHIFLFLQCVLIIFSHQGFIRYIHKSFSSSAFLKCSSFQKPKRFISVLGPLMSTTRSFLQRWKKCSFQLLYLLVYKIWRNLNLKLHTLSLMIHITFYLFHILYLPFLPNTPTSERVN